MEKQRNSRKKIEKVRENFTFTRIARVKITGGLSETNLEKRKSGTMGQDEYG